jgi:hypothetical protein
MLAVLGIVEERKHLVNSATVYSTLKETYNYSSSSLIVKADVIVE